VLERQGGGAVLGTKEEDDSEAIRRNFAILQRPDGSVSRVVEKPRHAPNRLKGVGIYLFDPVIFDGIRRTPRTALRDEYELTDAIQVMIDDGHPVRPANVVSADVNVTTPADLLRVNLLHAAHRDPVSAVAPNVCLHPQAHIENSVIGPNVTVQNPIVIAHSLILENTIVNTAAPVDRVIIAPEGMYDCRPTLDLSQLSAGW
jgi:dTDP-glucose pyrophosphorylase